MTYEVVGSTTLPSPDDSSPYDSGWTINNAGTVGGVFYTHPPGYPELAVGYNLSPAGDFSFPSYPGWKITDAEVTNNNGLSFGNAEVTNGLGDPTTPPFGYIENNGIFTALPSGQYGSA